MEILRCLAKPRPTAAPRSRRLQPRRRRRCTLPAVKPTHASKRARSNCTTRHARNATSVSAPSKRSSAAPIARPYRPGRLAAHPGAARRDRGAPATSERDRRGAESCEIRGANRHDDRRLLRISAKAPKPAGTHHPVEVSMAFDVSRYHLIASDELAQRWISLRERLGAPETTLKAYASDLNDYLRWCSSRRRPPYPLALDGIADYVRDMRERPAGRGQRRSFGRRIGLEPTTVYRRITTLRLWFDYLVDVEVIGRSAFTRENSRFSSRSGLIRKPVNTPWLPNDRDWQTGSTWLRWNHIAIA